MKTFRLLVFQDMKGYYKGTLEIEANSKKEALKLIKSLNQNEIEDLCDDWTLSDDTYEDGPIDIDFASIEEI